MQQSWYNKLLLLPLYPMNYSSFYGNDAFKYMVFYIVPLVAL